MPEPLIARSALRAHVAPASAPGSAPGARLREVQDVLVATVAAFKGREDELAAAVRERYGLDLPAGPVRAAAGASAFIGAGPGKWLFVSSDPSADPSGLPAAVVDQSDGRTTLSLSGPAAREILSTLVSIDLHPRAFGPGAAAATHASGVAVHLWQVDDAPTYEIAVFRSYAATLWRWIAHAGAARGIDAAL
ncbi:sarcosine oxidase subunit gamma [Chenggangzhangella methanolivorans]|uniref:Sarcosine oxidase subunit gamma n=1 Tax=Chenggangzhangella methanolivorans TaxID=1437009 RepID=A0A9E6UPC2_9HYPH|nr:sarcosine oxidase subunit gamma family protein [Chenggangzhangella methanolivorans]QZO02176.1 hypothetical protein K6K41_13535 [Chenggangzhangella methanolivorans]